MTKTNRVSECCGARVKQIRGVQERCILGRQEGECLQCDHKKCPACGERVEKLND